MSTWFWICPKRSFNSSNNSLLHVFKCWCNNRAQVFCHNSVPLPLCSGSRLGHVYHHDVRVAQHHVGTLPHKQAVCALKWSPDGRLLSSGCSDGLLTIWPHDPGVHAQSQPIKVIAQPTAVKVRNLVVF